MNREPRFIGLAREATDIADSPPTSVLLPTNRWTDACGEIADQLRDMDELLVIHDDDNDPVAGRTDIPEGVRLIAAGEPEGCSGKANAIAAGMEAACHDRLIWTDDDFHHLSDWLETLNADYECHGPVSEVPYFVGRDPLAGETSDWPVTVLDHPTVPTYYYEYWISEDYYGETPRPINGSLDHLILTEPCEELDID